MECGVRRRRVTEKNQGTDRHWHRGAQGWRIVPAVAHRTGRGRWRERARGAGSGGGGYCNGQWSGDRCGAVCTHGDGSGLCGRPQGRSRWSGGSRANSRSRRRDGGAPGRWGRRMPAAAGPALCAERQAGSGNPPARGSTGHSSPGHRAALGERTLPRHRVLRRPPYLVATGQGRGTVNRSEFPRW